MDPQTELDPASRVPTHQAAVRRVPPPVDVLGPDGRAWTVRPATPDDTIGDLARAMGLDPDRVAVDGRWVAAAVRVAAAPGLLVGARLSQLDGPGGGGGIVADASAVVEVAVDTGPAVRTWTGLGPGYHTIGRSRAATIRVDDPQLEPFHGVLDVTGDGTVTFRQLTGALVARLAGHPCDGTVAWSPGESVEIGSSTVRIRRPVDAPTEAVVDPAAPGGEPAAPGGEPGAAVGDPAATVEPMTVEPTVVVDPAAPGGEPRPPGLTVPTVSPGDPWRRVVRRTRRDPHPVVEPGEWCAPAPRAEHPWPPATGLVGAAVGVAGAVVMAVVLGHAGFALFALVGAAAALATWVAGLVSVQRRRRADRRAHARSLADLAAGLEDLRTRRRRWHVDRHPTAVDALAVLRSGAGGVWCRRPGRDGEPDGLRAVVGIGEHPCDVSVTGSFPPDVLDVVERCGRLDEVAAPIVLDPGAVDAIVGPAGRPVSLARSVLVQLATWYGPADWALVVVSARPAAWAWSRWLPHIVRSDGRSGVLDSSTVTADATLDDVVRDIDDRRTLVVVTDDAEMLVSPTGPVRRAVTQRAAAVLTCLDEATPLPACCRRVLHVGVTMRARWSGWPDDPPGEAPAAGAGTSAGAPPERASIAVRAAGLAESSALEAARRLAPLVDPEERRADAGVPTDVGLLELVGAAPSATEVAARWSRGGRATPPAAPLGIARTGVVTVDLVRDGPHALIAGTTGSGKSELLRTLVASLALHVGPDQLTFVLVDYKGGATFDRCTRLPHTVGVVTDLDENGAARALASLDAEIRRRERLLRSAGAADLHAYREVDPDHPLPRLVVVVDEFAALARELPDFLRSLVDVAQRGRSLGLHLILATQRPAGVVSEAIRVNASMRIALRLPDPADARDVVADAAPVTISRAHPGRAVLRLGADDLVTFQSARCTAPLADRPRRLTATPDDRAPRRPGSCTEAPCAPTELDHVVTVVAEAARRIGCATPRRPWHDPLPELLRPADVDAAGCAGPGSMGLVDDPAAQAVHPLSWEPAAGTLALVGAVGAGLTTTLIALVTSWCAQWPADQLHVYVVDALGDGRLDALAAIAHCGGVIRLHEHERLHRLVGRLARDVDAAAATPDPRRPRSALVVDGLGALRRLLAGREWTETEVRLDRVLRDGPTVGVSAVLADHGAAPTTGGTPIAERWVFHLADPNLAGACGVRPGAAPSDVPGRVRIVSSGLEAQVALGADGLAALPHRGVRGGPAAIEVLPDRVLRADLADTAGVSPPAAPGTRRLVLGLDAEDHGPAWLDVPEGEHVTVVGAARTGVSTALRGLAAAWGARFGTDRVVWWRHGTGCVDGDDLDHVLVAVDDAHRVDPDPWLLAAARGRVGGVTLAVGMRADVGAYGHWTRDVVRSGIGVVMTSTGRPAGEPLGVTLTGRCLPSARPGLAWIVDGAGERLAQVAIAGSAQATSPSAQASGGVSPSSQRGPAPSSPARSSGL